jgi:DNA-binding CsgD family transcriptional regulator
MPGLETNIREGSAPATIEDLVRRLVVCAHCEAGGPEPSEGASAESVLLDIDVDGARYLLTRLPRNDRPRVQLSPREMEIVRMVAQGHSNKVIAGVLSISSWTVCTHLRRIFAKAGVGSRAALVARFLEPGGAAARSAAESARAVRRQTA